MERVILLRYGEIHLKGHNRGYFERILIKNIRSVLQGTEATVARIAGRYVIKNYELEKETLIIEKVRKVFGLISLSSAVEIPTSVDGIKQYCGEIELSKGTFKVNTRRADKTFPIPSPEFNAEIGGILLDKNPGLSVDIHTPQTVVNIDIRESGKTYIFFHTIACVGGMPVSTSGKGLLLLSGGIDSPVAGYLMAKRGLSIEAIYFHSFPYTSDQAKSKVISLAQQLTNYCGEVQLFIVPFTKIQEEINALCVPEYLITVMRRFMMKIAEKIAQREKCECLITGESLAQVASQTVQGITCSNSALEELPLLRPLIAYDKIEIIDIARRIGTLETSSLPYEDCCTVFVPDSPVIHPTVKKAKHEEEKILDREDLIDFAVNNCEIVLLRP